MKYADSARKIWQRSVETCGMIGAAPLVGGFALAHAVVRKDINDFVEVGATIGVAVSAHNVFHRLMGTEIYFDNTDPNDGIIGWRVTPDESRIDTVKVH